MFIHQIANEIIYHIENNDIATLKNLKVVTRESEEAPKEKTVILIK